MSGPTAPNGRRLAYLVSQYPATTHTFILREIRTLREQGFDVEVIAISEPDTPRERMSAVEREEAQRTRYIKSVGLLGALREHVAAAFSRPLDYLRGLGYALALAGPDARRILRYLFYFGEAVVAGRWIAERGLGHAHVHFSSTVATIMARVFPVTFSVTLHGPDEFTDPAGFNLREKVAQARFVIAISNFARSQIMRFSDRADWVKLEVVPLGVDPSLFAPGLFRSSPSPFEVLSVGRLAPVKAQHVLVAAVARLVAQGYDVRLRIVGGGPDRESLEREASGFGLGDRVIFEGPQSQDRVRELCRTADAFALASFAEGVPVVLMEAMASGLPCVATRVNGVPELIRHGEDGLLVAASDVAELANAIASLVDDAELRHRFRDAGRRRVQAQYDLEKNVARLAEIFRARLLEGTEISAIGAGRLREPGDDGAELTAKASTH